ncbi:terpene synthase family protein [Micromonospora sp. NPDC126480]|uniref:terpene synthase family protein n=1 Tax=Micromonospora sp. NPDC126480 TaxID=3155312 RepID=UPI0033338700
MSAGPGSPVLDQLAQAAEQGRICALAADGQRDLRRTAERYPQLFPAPPFDPALFGSVALAISFGAPECEAEHLRLTNRTVLWGFAVDWLVDHEATSRAEIDSLADACLAVADGAPPAADQPLARLLAEIRDELVTSPGYLPHAPVWRDQVRTVFAAMAREWDWRRSGHRPSLDDYLRNAANLACTVVNVTHWIRSGDPETLAHLGELVTVSDQVQQVLRLVNDFGTYQRDRRWGDLNALDLVADRAEVEQRLDVLQATARRSIDGLSVSCPEPADYLARQIGFSSGFYRLADYWGDL